VRMDMSKGWDMGIIWGGIKGLELGGYLLS
jgi:hypothetical protein